MKPPPRRDRTNVRDRSTAPGLDARRAGAGHFDLPSATGRRVGQELHTAAHGPHHSGTAPTPAGRTQLARIAASAGAPPQAGRSQAHLKTSRRRTSKADHTSLRRPAQQTMSDGRKGDTNSRLSARHGMAEALQWRGMERAPGDRVAQRVVEDGGAAHEWLQREA